MLCLRLPLVRQGGWRAFSTATAAGGFPVVDIASLRAGSDPAARDEAVSQIQLAASTHGFFYISGTGAEAARRKRVFSATKEFFASDQAHKDSIAFSSSRPGFTRGYIGVGGESGSDLNECKEAFSYGFEPPAGGQLAAEEGQNDLEGPNVWPAQDCVSEGWNADMQKFYDDMCDVSSAVTTGLSQALGHESKYLPSFCNEGHKISLMRLFHYLPYDHTANGTAFGASANDRIGSSPHTDWGFLTLVVQEDDQADAGGLEVFFDDTWVPLPPVEDSIIVNCGDFVSLFSGGRVKSPLHRVVNGDKDRYSLVFFYYPDYDANIPTMDALKKGTPALSLLKDQRAGHGGAGESSGALDVPFGRYIAQKWASVSRQEAN
jgi:isopenicillin N synthase-like dioxygenase